jgi:hypothetical protein
VAISALAIVWFDWCGNSKKVVVSAMLAQTAVQYSEQ